MMKPPLAIGPGPIGTRVYYEIDSGTVAEGHLVAGSGVRYRVSRPA